MKTTFLPTFITLLFILIISSQGKSQGIDINYEERTKNALTVGILNGGGLVGAELETLIGNRTGAHIGFGFIGACAGLDFHLKPTTKSSYFTVEYRAQGLGEVYTAMTLGGGFVLRTHGLSLQIGAAYLLDKGPNTIENWNTRNILPQVSLGFYNAF